MESNSIRRPPSAQPANTRGERKLDHWLRQSLSEAHDGVLTEGLPPSWLALIDRKLPRG